MVAISLAGTANAETLTIAAFGDSLTQGFGLPADQGFVPQLQAWLDAAGADAQLINAGVSGDTTQGGLSRIAWTLTDDVDAVIVTLGGNDLLRGLDPALSRENLDGILSVIGEAGLPALLFSMTAPANYGQDYKTAFDSMYADLAEKHGAALGGAFLEPIQEAVAADPAKALAELMQGDAIHPNADGVRQIVERHGPAVLRLIEAARG